MIGLSAHAHMPCPRKDDAINDIHVGELVDQSGVALRSCTDRGVDNRSQHRPMPGESYLCLLCHLSGPEAPGVASAGVGSAGEKLNFCCVK